MTLLVQNCAEKKLSKSVSGYFKTKKKQEKAKGRGGGKGLSVCTTKNKPFFAASKCDCAKNCELRGTGSCSDPLKVPLSGARI